MSSVTLVFLGLTSIGLGFCLLYSAFLIAKDIYNDLNNIGGLGYGI